MVRTDVSERFLHVRRRFSYNNFVSYWFETDKSWAECIVSRRSQNLDVNDASRNYELESIDRAVVTAILYDSSVPSIVLSMNIQKIAKAQEAAGQRRLQ